MVITWEKTVGFCPLLKLFVSSNTLSYSSGDQVVVRVSLPHVVSVCYIKTNVKEVLYEVLCLKSNEDMILALARQFKQLSHEPEKFR